MDLLITGAGGFIGTHLCSSLYKEHNIHRVDSFLNPNSDNDYYAVDLTDGKVVENLIDVLSKQNIDTIVHLASRITSPDMIDVLDILRENIAITENIVLLVKEMKPKVLINFSSMAVYPNISGSFSEDSLPGPHKNTDCIYGLSKYNSEVIIDFLLRDENIRVVHLRVAQVHGEGMREDRIIPVMRKELKENNTITLFGSGERESSFIEINKLVEVIEFFLTHEVSGVYNVGDENLSYYDLAEIVVNQYGNEKSTIVKQPHGSKEKFNLDSSKLQEMMNS
jgi:nucleoside-diphosphate-sugar epimerase